MKAYYYWNGSKEPKYLLSCKRSWEEHGLKVEKISLDYQDFLHVPYVARYARKENWALVSDYLRYVWFQDHDGLYMDADMFLIKKVPDIFLEADFSISCISTVASGQGIMRIKKGNPIIEKLCNFYENFERGVLNINSSSDVFKYVTNQSADFICEKDEVKDLNGIRYFGRTYCYPIPIVFILNAVNPHGFFSEKTFGIHQWHASQSKKGGILQKRVGRWYEHEVNQKLLKDVLKTNHCEYFTREE